MNKSHLNDEVKRLESDLYVAHDKVLELSSLLTRFREENGKLKRKLKEFPENCDSTEKLNTERRSNSTTRVRSSSKNGRSSQERERFSYEDHISKLNSELELKSLHLQKYETVLLAISECFLPDKINADDLLNYDLAGCVQMLERQTKNYLKQSRDFEKKNLLAKEVLKNLGFHGNFEEQIFEMREEVKNLRDKNKKNFSDEISESTSSGWPSDSTNSSKDFEISGKNEKLNSLIDDRLRSYEKLFDKLKLKNFQQEETIETLRNEISRLEFENSNLETELDLLKKEYGERVNNFDEFENVISNLEDSKNQTILQNKSLRSELENLKISEENELSKFKASEKNLSAEIQKLKTSISDLEMKNKELISSRNDLEIKLQKSLEDYEELKNENQFQEGLLFSEANKFRKEKRGLKVELKNLENKFESISTELTELKIKCSTDCLKYKNAEAKLIMDLDELNGLCLELENKRKESERANVEHSAQKEKLAAKVAEYENLVADLKSNVENLTQRNFELDRNYDYLNAQLISQQKKHAIEISTYESTEFNLKRDNEDLSKMNSQFEGQIKRLNEDLNSFRDEIRAHKETETDLKSMNEIFKNQRLNFEIKIEEIESVNAKLFSEKVELENKMSKYIDHEADLKNINENLKKQYLKLESKNEETEKLIAKLIEEKGELENEINKYIDSEADLKKINKNMQASILEQVEKLDKLKVEFHSLKDEYDNKMFKSKTLENSLQRASENLKEFSADLENERKVSKKLNEQILFYENEMRGEIAKRANIENDFKICMKVLGEIESELREKFSFLKEFYDKLKNNIKMYENTKSDEIKRLNEFNSNLRGKLSDYQISFEKQVTKLSEYITYLKIKNEMLSKKTNEKPIVSSLFPKKCGNENIPNTFQTTAPSLDICTNARGNLQSACQVFDEVGTNSGNWTMEEDELSSASRVFDEPKTNPGNCAMGEEKLESASQIFDEAKNNSGSFTMEQKKIDSASRVFDESQTNSANCTTEQEKSESLYQAFNGNETNSVNCTMEQKKSESVYQAFNGDETNSVNCTMEPKKSESVHQAFNGDETNSVNCTMEQEKSESVSQVFDESENSSLNCTMEQERSKSVYQAFDEAETNSVNCAMEREELEATSQIFGNAKTNSEICTEKREILEFASRGFDEAETNSGIRIENQDKCELAFRTFEKMQHNIQSLLRTNGIGWSGLNSELIERFKTRKCELKFPSPKNVCEFIQYENLEEKLNDMRELNSESVNAGEFSEFLDDFISEAPKCLMVKDYESELRFNVDRLKELDFILKGDKLNEKHRSYRSLSDSIDELGKSGEIINEIKNDFDALLSLVKKSGE